MTTLFAIHKSKLAIANTRSRLLGREFTIGLVIGIVVAVDVGPKSVIFVPLRWARPSLFRWRGWFPQRRNPHNGHLHPGGFRPARGGGNPLPDHTPQYCGIHMLNHPTT